MTLESPQQMLMNTYNSAITYSLELLEDEDTPEELLVLVKEFLQQAEQVNKVVNNREAASSLLKELKVIG
ncbi:MULTISPECIES: hypothetical protein [Bacillus]|uniref:Uncharacterized protein n=1 Tax=Bacillus wiedmannii TaxID=1890302 RepID=A0AB37Z1P7_9BACI|nr:MULTISPECIES: hypothetical protein [Bacillus]MDJ1473927.1 hypothetical protein [Bacillus sp. LS15-K4]PFC99691.1 hypothetical protein CN308_02460 [Bacillus cereus]SCC68992.1 Protein of unknown function [Bacillus wiedmannii]